MTHTRKTADIRSRELRLAIHRIEQGRARTGESKLTIAAVAREAGVSTALIHNSHPDIAAAIRSRSGRSNRARLDDRQQQLQSAQEKLQALRQEARELRAKLAKLASINEVLLMDNRDLRQRLAKPEVVAIASRKKGA